jgi:flavin-dependent dehydrogenase
LQRSIFTGPPASAGGSRFEAARLVAFSSIALELMKTSYDIAVIGAGAAGVMAASAAASHGARVILLETSDRLGGAVTAAMHRSLCGLYATTPRFPVDTLNDGAQRQFIERLVAKAPDLVQPRQFGKAWVLEFPTAAYEASLAEALSEAKVEHRMNARVVAVNSAIACTVLR